MSFDLPSAQDAIIALVTIAGVAVLFTLAFVAVSGLMSRGWSRRSGKPVTTSPDFAHAVATDSVPEYSHAVATDRIPEFVSR
jgi:hypothetical protein